MRQYFYVPSLILLMGVSACSPAKGYLGPDRPDNEVSIVEANAYDNLSLLNESISGFELGLSGIAVLPGKQEFSARATLGEAPYNCRPYTEFNSSGFYDCEKERSKKNQYNDCDCYDYSSVYESCEQVIKEGACRVSFTTRAAEKYEVAVGMYLGAPVVKVRELSTAKEVGSGKCSKDGQRVVDTTNYIGQGRSVANRAGFYSCYGY